MTIHTPDRPRFSAQTGMTLIELTVVILVLLSLISVLFIGSRAWKRGSDRAGCTVQIRQVQMGVRSFANMKGIFANQDVSPLDLKTEVIGTGKFVESDPICPGNGTYAFGGNTVPGIGTLYMTCSLSATLGHEPKVHAHW